MLGEEKRGGREEVGGGERRGKEGRGKKRGFDKYKILDLNVYRLC